MTQVEAETCKGCGQPLHKAMDDDTAGEWIGRQATCWSCRAKQIAESRSNGEHGVRAYTEHLPRNN